MKSYDDNYPIVLGLAGEAATGKTVTANGLAPAARVVTGEETGIYWEHLYFAMPLYRMSNARQNIEGNMAFDRMCYEIHTVLTEIWPSPIAGAPSYPKLVQMVLEIAEHPIPKEGKPRSFLQYVGTDLCRAYDDDCWVNWMKGKIHKEYVEWKKENGPRFNYTLADVDHDQHSLMTGRPYGDPALHTFHDDIDEIGQKFAVVISDVRFPNEAEMIANHPNGILVKLTADDKVLKERQLERDGFVMDAKQKAHASEKGVSQIPAELFDIVMDTSDMTVKEQVYNVHNLVAKFAGV